LQKLLALQRRQRQEAHKKRGPLALKPEPAWNIQPKRASQILEDEDGRKVLQNDGGGNAGETIWVSQRSAEQNLIRIPES
jgi:hypothetical protein